MRNGMRLACGKKLLMFSFAALLPATSFATTIFTDTFEGGTSTGWSAGSSPASTISVADDATFGSKALDVSSGGSDGSLLHPSRAFTSTSLAVGDTITLTADFRFLDGPGNSTTGVRLGIAGGSGASTVGYALTYGSGTNNGGVVGKRTGSSVFTSGVTDLGTTGTAGSVNDTLAHSLSLSVTRTLTGVDISASVDGNTFTASDTSSPNTTFSTVMFQNGASDQFALDNVQVALTSAPEPASLGLLGVGALGLLTRRRSR